MKRIRTQVYTLVVVALVLVACTAPSSTPPSGGTQSSTTNSIAGTPCASVMAALDSPTADLSQPTATPFLPSPIASFIYPTPIPTIDTPTSPTIVSTPASPTIVSTPGTPNPRDKINADLAKAMKDNPKSVDFIVLLKEQPSLEGTSSMGQTQAGKTIQDRITEVSQRTQPAVKAAIILLEQEGEVSQYAALDSPNSFHVIGTAHAVEVLAARDDIGYLQPNYHYLDATGESSNPGNYYPNANASPTIQPTQSAPRCTPTQRSSLQTKPNTSLSGPPAQPQTGNGTLS